MQLAMSNNDAVCAVTTVTIQCIQQGEKQTRDSKK